MSLLAGVDKMRFAFVQRADASANNHKVVGSFTSDTLALKKQLQLNMENCWAVLKDVLETLMEREEENGEFLYIKDLNQVPTYRLVKVVEEDEDLAENEEMDDGL